MVEVEVALLELVFGIEFNGVTVRCNDRVIIISDGGSGVGDVVIVLFCFRELGERVPFKFKITLP